MTRPTIPGTDAGVGPDDRHPLAPAVSAAVTAGTLAVAFGLLALDVEFFWVAFVVGFGGVLPVSLAVLAFRRSGQDRTRRSDPSSGAETPLGTLRERYARGEITDEAFERQVERLLETESDPAGTDRRRQHPDRAPDRP